jgi:prepilin-type N-terminal cleavage/methylation domain-containing protein
VVFPAYNFRERAVNTYPKNSSSRREEAHSELRIASLASRINESQSLVTSAATRGFSLIEILVVIGLLSVIILGLLTMFNQTQRAFRTGMTQVDVLAAGRAATEMIARELSQMTPASYSSNAVNFYAKVQEFPPLLQPLPGTASPSELRTNLLSEMFFLMQENQTGEPHWSGIGYWVGDPATGGNPTGGWGTLYRFQANTAFGVSPSPSLLYSNYYYQPNTRTNLSSRIIDGVVHFKVRAFTTNGTWITPVSPDVGIKMRTRMQYSQFVPAEVDYVTGPRRRGLFTFTDNAVPAFVELELGILEERALARVKSIPDAATRTKYLEDQAGRVQIFRMRIPVRNVDPTAYQ